jgi:hypothetical protein
MEIHRWKWEPKADHFRLCILFSVAVFFVGRVNGWTGREIQRKYSEKYSEKYAYATGLSRGTQIGKSGRRVFRFPACQLFISNQSESVIFSDFETPFNCYLKILQI